MRANSTLRCRGRATARSGASLHRHGHQSCRAHLAGTNTRRLRRAGADRDQEHGRREQRGFGSVLDDLIIAACDAQVPHRQRRAGTQQDNCRRVGRLAGRWWQKSHRPRVNIDRHPKMGGRLRDILLTGFPWRKNPATNWIMAGEELQRPISTQWCGSEWKKEGRWQADAGLF